MRSLPSDRDHAREPALPVIAVVGCGRMGSAIAHLFAAKGYPIRLNSRRRRSALELARQLPHAVVGDLEETVGGADVIVLATPFQITRTEIVPRVRALAAGKPVMDVSNRDIFHLPGDCPGGPSAAEQLAAALPGSHVVKALNCVAARWLLDGSREAVITIPIAGDSGPAKHLVRTLLEHVGFEVADAGPLRTSRWIENLAPLLLSLGNAEGLGDAVGLHLVRLSTRDNAQAG